MCSYATRCLFCLDPSQAPDLTFSDGPFGKNSHIKVKVHAINKTRWGGPPHDYKVFFKPVVNMTTEENATIVDEWILNTDDNGDGRFVFS